MSEILYNQGYDLDASGQIKTYFRPVDRAIEHL